MNEYATIRDLFPNVKDLFRSDAQLISIGGETWGITCDTFSLREDLFTDEDPFRLGRNLVAATCSDLTATGCAPAFYQHSICFRPGDEGAWSRELARGIQSALDELGCVLIGGDLGRADDFTYTGIALGRQLAPVSRIFPPGAQQLYITGVPGKANLAALTGSPTPEFPLYSLPADMLACIDTSGGVADALWQLHELNPDFRIDARLDLVSDMRLLFGGAGEYELILTSAAPRRDGLLAIGSASPSANGSLAINGVAITQPPPDPRAFASLADYVQAVTLMTHELFGEDHTKRDA